MIKISNNEPGSYLSQINHCEHDYGADVTSNAISQWRVQIYMTFI